MHALVSSGMNLVVRAVSPQNLPTFMNVDGSNRTVANVSPTAFLMETAFPKKPEADRMSESVERSVKNAWERLECAKRLDASERYAEALAAYGVGIDNLTAIVSRECSNLETRRTILARLDTHRKRMEWIKTHLALCVTTRPFRYDVMSDLVMECVRFKSKSGEMATDEVVNAAASIRESGKNPEFLHVGSSVRFVVLFRLSWCLKNRYQRSLLLEVLRSVTNRGIEVVLIEIDGANLATGESAASSTSIRLKTEFFPTILVLVSGKRVLELHSLFTESDQDVLRRHLGSL